MRIVTVADAGAVVRGRRLDLGWPQGVLATKAGVSRKWVYEFEAGKATAELGHVLRVLDALGLLLSADTVGEPASEDAAGARLLDDVIAAHRRG